ncbi:MAG: DUF4255 domain-containing protein [Acidimicrobiia bacterium]|nr:DUF4255 domain-containing protein [Acidimicrobiia bacterium]
MFQLIDQALEQYLRSTVPLAPSEVDVSFAAPAKEWSARLSRPTVNLFLWDVRRAGTRKPVGRRRGRDRGQALPPGAATGRRHALPGHRVGERAPRRAPAARQRHPGRPRQRRHPRRVPPAQPRTARPAPSRSVAVIDERPKARRLLERHRRPAQARPRRSRHVRRRVHARRDRRRAGRGEPGCWRPPRSRGALAAFLRRRPNRLVLARRSRSRMGHATRGSAA